MKPGDAYRPYGLFHSALVPLAVLKDKRPQPGARLCFGLLAYHGGSSGQFPTQRTLAAEMACSIDMIKRYLAELAQAGYIRSRRLGRTVAYEFTWTDTLLSSLRKGAHPHPINHRHGAGLHDFDSDKGCISARDTVHTCGEQGADLHSAYKEEEDFKRSLRGTTTSSASVKANAADRTQSWWTSQEFEEARMFLHRHRGFGIPDDEILAKMLRHFRDFDEFNLWLSGLSLRAPVESWGLYLHDAAKNWPSRRRAAEHHRQANQRRSVELHQHFDTCETAPAGATAKTIDQSAALTPPLNACVNDRCARCEDVGMQVIAQGYWDWCGCDAGQKLRTSEPNAVDAANAEVGAMYSRFSGQNGAKVGEEARNVIN